jgi:hypothetical protein
MIVVNGVMAVTSDNSTEHVTFNSVKVMSRYLLPEQGQGNVMLSVT